MIRTKITLQLILFFGLLIFILPPAYSKSPRKIFNPFLAMQYDKVIAYDYDSGEGHPIVNGDGELSKSISKQKQLTLPQIDRVNHWLGDFSTYGGTTALCFQPRLGLVYYRKGNVVAYVSICLECNYLESSQPLPAIADQRKISVGKKFSYSANGFSKAGRKKINDFCKEMGFVHCLDKLDSMFDK